MTDALFTLLPQIMPTEMVGSIVHTDGLATSVAGFPAPVGALVEIERQSGSALRGEVIGFRGDTTIIYPFGNVSGVRRGNRVRLVSTARFIRVGEALLGRVIDAQGKPLDDQSEPGLTARTRLDRSPPSAVERPRIHAPLTTGIRRSMPC